MSETDKVYENRLRRMAKRQGLTLEKSRRRDPTAQGYGTYALIRAAEPGDASGRFLLAGDPSAGRGLTLEQVEQALTDARAVRVLGPDFQGDRGLDAFRNGDTTPTVEWDPEDECWYLSIATSPATLQMWSLPGGPSDEELAANLGRRALAVMDHQKTIRAERTAARLAETLPVRTFHTGKAFYHAGRRLVPDVELAPGVYESLTWPACVNFCFSSENFVKALLLLRFGSRPKIHRLKDLFGRLSAEDRAAIAARYADHPQQSISDDLEEVDNYFDELRYQHEYLRRGYWHVPAGRLADCLYRYAASVLGEEARGDIFRM